MSTSLVTNTTFNLTEVESTNIKQLYTEGYSATQIIKLIPAIKTEENILLLKKQQELITKSSWDSLKEIATSAGGENIEEALFLAETKSSLQFLIIGIINLLKLETEGMPKTKDLKEMTDALKGVTEVFMNLKKMYNITDPVAIKLGKHKMMNKVIALANKSKNKDLYQFLTINQEELVNEAEHSESPEKRVI